MTTTPVEEELVQQRQAAREDILVSLEILAEERQKIIEETRRERRELDEMVRLRLDEIKTKHRNANRVLVEAIAAAQKEGVRKADICERLELSIQAANQMRRTVEQWDEEQRKARKRKR